MYILQPSAYSARSGTGNRSSPFTLIVGLPANRSSWASSSVLTAIRSTSASRPSSSRTSRKVFSALRYVGHPSKYRISICIALRLLDASWRTYTIAPYGPNTSRGAYSPECVEGAFCELRFETVRKGSEQGSEGAFGLYEEGEMDRK